MAREFVSFFFFVFVIGGFREVAKVCGLKFIFVLGVFVAGMVVRCKEVGDGGLCFVEFVRGDFGNRGI